MYLTPAQFLDLTSVLMMVREYLLTGCVMDMMTVWMVLMMNQVLMRQTVQVSGSASLSLFPLSLSPSPPSPPSLLAVVCVAHTCK